jgi:hypothetical protein
MFVRIIDRAAGKKPAFSGQQREIVKVMKGLAFSPGALEFPTDMKYFNTLLVYQFVFAGVLSVFTSVTRDSNQGLSVQ